MKVYFYPEYSGFVYLNLEKNPLQFDVKICNTEQLVELLELHAGIHTQTLEQIDRVIEYYKAIQAFNNENPGNMFEASFKIDGLSVAAECLSWRDSFILSGWNPNEQSPSKRMETLSQIEKYFGIQSEGERLLNITKQIISGCRIPENLEIITPYDWHCFQPAVISLLKALSDKGAKVYVNPDIPSQKNNLHKTAQILEEGLDDPLTLDSDSSLEIWNFKEKKDALQYISQLNPDDFSLWINRNNKELDNWLNYVGKPVTAASDKGSSQISQLPFIGLNIFERPLNITSIVNWLSVPISPLSFSFRTKLIGEIVNSGGYINARCQKLFDEASDTDKKYAKLFLPAVDDREAAIGAKKELPLQTYKDFLENLEKWITNYLASENLALNKRGALEAAGKVCSTMLKILSLSSEKELELGKLLMKFDSMKVEVSNDIFVSQSGCANITESPANIAVCSEKTLWCDFYNPDEIILSTEFMLASEKKYLESKNTLWKAEDERKYYRLKNLIPFLYTSEKLVLVTADKVGTCDTVKDPVIIRLIKNMGEDEDGNDIYEAFVKKPSILDFDEVTLQSPIGINNRSQDYDGTVSFERTDLVDFPAHESFSAISTLIDSPFDYTFDKLINLKKEGAAALDPIFTTRGSVAHAVIEKIFSPQNNSIGAEILEDINNNFDKIMEDTLLETGGIMLQQENLADTEIFKKNMKQCLLDLYDFIIEKNHLTVVACENSYREKKIVEFDNHGIDFRGDIDMLLLDENNRQVILDFKYSTKDSKYSSWIKNNRSMQLSLYKALARNNPDEDIRSAYVLLPGVKVITKDDFNGVTFKVIPNPNSAGNLLTRMSNSYGYRKEQILSGKVEDGEYMNASELAYYRDTKEKNLVPLECDNHPKQGTVDKHKNEYSDYSIFKQGNK